MAIPTTSIYLNKTAPAPPSGDQNVVFQSDNGTPQQKITAYPQTATTSLRGVVKPDGTSITVASDGTLSAVAGSTTKVIGLVIDGGGSAPIVGSKGFVQVPFACTITGWTMMADQSGSAQVSISKGTFASFPSMSSIDASLPPNITSAQKNSSTTLTGWTTAVAAGDVIGFNLDTVTTIQRITLDIQVVI